VAAQRDEAERGSLAGLGRMKGTRRLLTRRPTTPSRAGSSVTAASMVIATISAEAHPMTASIGMPASCMPAMATTTVTPANITDRPAVALARPLPRALACRRRGVAGAWRARRGRSPMPTPRPSITPTMVAIWGTAICPERMPMALVPIRMPVSATAMGRLMAHQ
jgi:hypothetical protein